MNTVVYVHGKGGSADESVRYQPLFPGCRVVGLDYRTFTPWETGTEIRTAIEKIKPEGDGITLIANSIGAFFSLHAGICPLISRAFFISPVVDMERLILDMMAASGVTEEALKEKLVIPTAFGEDLSWNYLSYVRAHPIRWNVPTEILYGKNDELTDFETISSFAEKIGAGVTVMDAGGHWFHTEEEMRYLDGWIMRKSIVVRPLKTEETAAALALAWRVFSEFEAPDYSLEGTEEFRKSINDEAYLSGIVYYGAFDGREPVGVLGVRKEKAHICFFFVDGRYHRRGIGTRLFCRMREDFRDRTITLNSAPFGLPFYKKLGFEPTDGEQNVKGIRFTPMRYDFRGMK